MRVQHASIAILPAMSSAGDAHLYPANGTRFLQSSIVGASPAGPRARAAVAFASTMFYQIPGPISPAAAAALGSVIALLLASCSTIAIKRLPSAVPSSEGITCTDSLTYPLIDMAITVVTGVTAIALISADSNKGNTPTSAIGLGLVSVGAVASAIYGTYQVGRCRDALTERLSGARPQNSLPIRFGRGVGCQSDEQCEKELRCDAPMKVCVPQQTGAP